MDNKAFETAPTPELILNPTVDAEAQKPDIASFDGYTLTEEEQKTVDNFAEQIDITDSATVMQYGSASQQKIAGFSDSALEGVRTKDFGELGDQIAELIVELKGIDDEDKGGFFSFFNKGKKKIAKMKIKYDEAEESVNGIVKRLEEHQIVLMKDIAMLDRMYDMNLNYFRELTMYILAGKKKLEKERTTTLEALKATAAASGLPEDAQKASDFAQMCDRFEKKIHDLELTRMICIQMGPQIRLIQNNDAMMTEKIQSVIVNTIPLWKSQMVLALGIAHSDQAMKAQRSVTDMTNDLLRKNAETLKQGTIDIAKESERGIVDIETLTETNKKLIETLDEVQKIQTEGKEKRRAAEVELGKIEGELRTKLLDINSPKKDDSK